MSYTPAENKRRRKSALPSANKDKAKPPSAHARRLAERCPVDGKVTVDSEELRNEVRTAARELGKKIDVDVVV